MASRRENGTDINNWSFHELEDLVQEFRVIQDRKDHALDNTNQPTDSSHASHSAYHGSGQPHGEVHDDGEYH